MARPLQVTGQVVELTDGSSRQSVTRTVGPRYAQRSYIAASQTGRSPVAILWRQCHAQVRFNVNKK